MKALDSLAPFASIVEYATIIAATSKLYTRPLILIFLKFPSEKTSNNIPEEIIITDSWSDKVRFSSNNIGVNANKINDGNPRAIGYP